MSISNVFTTQDGHHKTIIQSKYKKDDVLCWDSMKGRVVMIAIEKNLFDETYFFKYLMEKENQERVWKEEGDLEVVK